LFVSDRNKPQKSCCYRLCAFQPPFHILHHFISFLLVGNDPLPKRAPTLRKLSDRFLQWVEDSNKAAKTKTYYRSGWRLLDATRLAGMILTEISSDDISMTRIPGGPSNVNCARRTLRRMLRMAQGWNLSRSSPRVPLVAEHFRRERLTADYENRLLVGASKCKWKPERRQRFRDVVMLMRDTGMRNERELYRVRVEHIDLERRELFVPDSKTPEGRRVVPILDRAHDILMRLTAGRTEGWLFPAKRGRERRMTTLSKSFREAREAAGLPEDLVLYSGRHDCGTEVYRRTGNLALVMRVLGHKEPKTAMRYQLPDVHDMRRAMDAPDSSRHTPRHTATGAVN
jgi:integrase